MKFDQEPGKRNQGEEFEVDYLEEEEDLDDPFNEDWEADYSSPI